MKEIIIDSFTSLLQFQENLDTNKFFCFRGQSNNTWELVPSIYHGLQDSAPPIDDLNDGQWIEEVEWDIYREFDRCCRKFMNNDWNRGNSWHRLFLAQHYGVPTRLLDWTRLPFVATYFATGGDIDKDGAVWCLNVTDFPHPQQLGRLAKRRGHRLEALDYCINRSDLKFFVPISKPVGIPSQSSVNSALPNEQSGNADWSGFLVILEPPVLEDRMKNQESLFTLSVTYNDELVWNHSDYIRRVEAKYSLDF